MNAFQKTELALQKIAKVVNSMLPGGIVFTLVVYSVGDSAKASYVSNGDRASMITAMRAVADRLEIKAESPPGANLEMH